jgi:hypothetical protein
LPRWLRLLNAPAIFLYYEKAFFPQSDQPAAVDFPVDPQKKEPLEKKKADRFLFSGVSSAQSAFCSVSMGLID